ncbi:50S ribosomal protein P1 [Candidatus Pacearchaeota archaeon CG10_big_fil_rev_8_21_14_0_10_34_12]|nr:MAG: 50S ribosomal protein P1 [Candidatus Pacearchaeota archaeon CG10_big_fil_rev_8_21_14_0_10_34_12]
MEYIYAALLLHKQGKEVSEDNVKSVVAATGSEVDDSKVKSLVANLKGVDINKELENASLAVANAPVAGGGASSSETEKKEPVKEEKKEAAAEGLSALFG